MDRLRRFDDRPDAGQRATQARGHHVYLDGLHGTRVLPDGSKSLGEKSLVIACSHSGNTQEVVDGCEMALAAGAEVVALTDCEGSKIDNGKWTTCLSVGRRRAAGRGAAGIGA